jgi:hypothetical protein
MVEVTTSPHGGQEAEGEKKRQGLNNPLQWHVPGDLTSSHQAPPPPSSSSTTSWGLVFNIWPLGDVKDLNYSRQTCRPMGLGVKLSAKVCMRSWIQPHTRSHAQWTRTESRNSPPVCDQLACGKSIKNERTVVGKPDIHVCKNAAELASCHTRE